MRAEATKTTMLKNIITSVVVSVIVTCGLFLVLNTHAQKSVENSFGATVGTTHIESLNISKGPFSLSFTNATTTGTSVTLQQSDFQPYNSLLVTPIVGAATLTLPASSTLSSLVPKVGDVQQLMVVNATSTSGISVTIAGGAGTLLRKATTTAAILPGGVSELEFVRKANSDIVVFFDEGI